MSTVEKREGGFSVTTVIAATPQQLYDAWTVEQDLNGWLANTSETDPRVGGTYTLRWPSPDGELSARGEYLELDPDRKIVFSWESWGPNGRMEGMDATVTVEFRDLDDGTTELTQSESSPTYATGDHMDMSIGGTIEAHKGLAAYLGSVAQD
jgi:uncharacterized protein YndB with AHSA1/START domain